MKRPAIIIDLDGTLCDTKHRQHFMEGPKKNWPAFYEALVDDKPHAWCLEIANRFKTTHEILFVSGRPMDYMKKTCEWLDRHFNTAENMLTMRLMMRFSGDFRKDSVVKTEIYKDIIEPHYDVLFCIDDRQQVVDAWRALGLTCLQCAPGDF